jgi:hypothetical protein
VFGRVASEATISRTIAGLTLDPRTTDRVLAAVDDTRARRHGRGYGGWPSSAHLATTSPRPVRW